jgi:hypothetical protein
LCARSGEKTALAQPSPLYRSQGHVSRRGAQARIAWRNAPQERCGCDLKRNGGEYAWSFLRISRAFGISSTKRRCRGCIGCEQTAAKRDGRPKTASTGTGLSDVDISYDQSSRWQKFAAVPEEISSARCREKPTVCRRLVTPISQSCARKRTLAAVAGRSALRSQGDLILKHLPRERPFHHAVAGRIEWPQRNATTSSARPETGRRR